MGPVNERLNVPSLRLSIKPPELDEVLSNMREVLLSGQLTLGAHGRSLEKDFASFVGMPFACAVNSGTSALEIALRAFGVEGKQVLVPSNTFFATPAAVLHAGGIPRFVDCDPYSLAMDYDSLVRRLTPQCVGVIVVHIGGPVTPCTEVVAEFCRERGLFLLEDAAHAHGSSLHGKQAGTFGDAAAFSFYPTKVMTSGEGGMIVTAKEKIYQEAVLYRDQGKESFSSNFHVRLGHNWRMSELHAVLGRSQLKALPTNILRRREIAQWYDAALRGVPGVTPQPLPAGSESNYYKYPVTLMKGIDRAELKRMLKEEWGVSLSGEVYTLPCHKQPVFEKYADVGLPGSEAACAQHVCLPLYPELTRAEAEYAVNAFKTSVNSLMKGVSH
jgi:dTDP-4-amino-4,6-dideoxygalactose transaminase